ncbi:phospholipase D-like domain-containing protein [Serratia marcescens]|uniref:phospholipase D-like domain-containing protein n=1 Tax=Serratia TaxID=613 RepID=UPI003EE27847
MRSSLKAWCLAATLAVVPGAMAAPSVQVGFSPEGSALQLVLSTLNEARSSIRLMGYSFTSPEVVKALTTAKHRGVDVKVVLDAKGNQNGEPAEFGKNRTLRFSGHP